MIPFSYGKLQLFVFCMILQPTNPPWKSKTQGSVPWWLEGQTSVKHLALISLQSLSQVCTCGTVSNFRYCNMPVREILNCLEMRCWDSDIKQVTSFSQQVFMAAGANTHICVWESSTFMEQEASEWSCRNGSQQNWFSQAHFPLALTHRKLKGRTATALWTPIFGIYTL